MKIQNSKLILPFALLFCILIFVFCISVERASAAILYLEPASGQYYQGDTFIVDVRIDTEKECINTVKADLSFSQDILELIDFSRGSSILTLWLKDPEIDQGKGLVLFTGGIPGGFCGIVPGDIGKSNLLGRIVFQTADRNLKETAEAQVEFLDSSGVLLNDGLGTPTELEVEKAVFTILPEENEAPKEPWKEELAKDNMPPESFEIKIHQGPAIFEGKYFIAFHTTDKQTGIDYYEIKEGKGDWQKGESPYLLKNQKLTSIIRVKAVDKAGNERIAEYLPPKKPLPLWIVVLVLAGIGFAYWLYRKSKFKTQILK